MTREEHRTWHIENYDSLEALFTDYTYHTKRSVSLRKFRDWSYAQTINPTETREEALDE